MFPSRTGGEAAAGAELRVTAEQRADSALWIVQRFFARDSFPERARYYAGEMLQHYRASPTLGAGLAPSVRVAPRALVRDEGRAVFAVTLSDSAVATDWYLYLTRTPRGWKLSAVRALAMPGLFHDLLDSLNALPDLPDSVARLRDRMRLATESDSALKQHLAVHLPAFDELAALMSQTPTLELIGHDGHVEPTAERSSVPRRLVELLQALRLSSAYRADGHPGCLFLPIAGIVDNEVGYLYAPPGCAVPEMNPALFIYVERVRGIWFVYKTT
ncbi:MAG: hypothetical protein ACREON_15755 [Gemmatimonadaceae bacterium]